MGDKVLDESLGGVGRRNSGNKNKLKLCGEYDTDTTGEMTEVMNEIDESDVTFDRVFSDHNHDLSREEDFQEFGQNVSGQGFDKGVGKIVTEGESGQESVKNVQTKVKPDYRKYNTKVTCSFCPQILRYRDVNLHCRTHHPDTPYDVRVKCSLCPRNPRISKVMIQFHKQIFHKEAAEGSSATIDNKKETTENKRNTENILRKRKPKYNQAITCDFCPNKKVHYYWYQKHCKSFHVEVPQVTRKCTICGHKVFISSFKHHMKIFHADKDMKEKGLKLESDGDKVNISKEIQKGGSFRIIFTDKGQEKSYKCLNYHTELSVLFKRYLGTLQVDGMVVTREQVLFRCRQVSLSGMELAGSFHNQTIQVHHLSTSD